MKVSTLVQAAFQLAVVLSMAIALVAARTSIYYPSPESHVPMPYRFKYVVDHQPSSNDYGHEEESDGNIVTGSYYVLLPDGRRQVVSYRADHTGYTASVKYEGESNSPTYPTNKLNSLSTHQHEKFPRPYYKSYVRNSYSAYHHPYSAQVPIAQINPSDTSNVVEFTNEKVPFDEIPAIELSTETVTEAILEASEQINSEPATVQPSDIEMASVTEEEAITTTEYAFPDVVELIAEPVTEKDAQPTTEFTYL